MRQLQNGESRVYLAVALIGGGLVLLALRFFGDAVGLVWPFFVIVPGAAVLALAMAPGWQSTHLAAAGAVVAGTGVILFVQELTDYYQSWAYAWTLLPVFAGAALLLVGRTQGDEVAKNRGRQLLQWGTIAFLVFAALFEALIFHGLVEGGLILPVLLIAAGALLLFRRTGGGPWIGSGGMTTPPPAGAGH
jgi:hypothetical protein